MATDLFNNISNDYIQPNLAPCPDAGDSYAFEFLGKKAVGVVNGSQTLASLLFSDFSQEITSWTQEKKIIQPGEVIYIAGLTKGITNKSETYFTNDITISASDNSSFYMRAHVEVNYYNNFYPSTVVIDVSSDYSLGVDVEDAINIEFANRGVGISVNYNDGSIFAFTGATAGYDFDVSTFSIVRYDTSTLYNLTKNTDITVPAFKYPNGAMLGYMLRTSYPASITTDSDKWLFINHVPDYYTYYDSSIGPMHTKQVDVGKNGYSTDTVMSAGDYLYRINTSQKWEKVGSMRAWISAPDLEDSIAENLITGFYLFNPQTFPIQIDYILIN